MSRPPLAELLDLAPHPEGGWFRRTWTSGTTITPPGYPGPRPSATGIYYLLGTGEQSAWHQVRSDELWLHHHGVPLLLQIAEPGPAPDDVTEIVLGPDITAGQQPQALVPADFWQAARPLADGAVLVSCVVSPGFDFADWTLM